jgi:hypothetical protein
MLRLSPIRVTVVAVVLASAGLLAAMFPAIFSRQNPSQVLDQWRQAEARRLRIKFAVEVTEETPAALWEAAFTTLEQRRRYKPIPGSEQGWIIVGRVQGQAVWDQDRAALSATSYGLGPEGLQPQSRSRAIWNGEQFQTRVKPIGEGDLPLMVSAGADPSWKNQVYSSARTGSLFGFLPGNRSRLIESAEAAEARDDLRVEAVTSAVADGVDREVLELSFSNDEGAHRIHLDPKRGFVAVWIQVFKEAPDLNYGLPLGTREPGAPPDFPIYQSARRELKVTALTQIDGSWVPTEGVLTREMTTSEGATSLTRAFIQVSDVDLEPASDRATFRMDGIPNGHTVRWRDDDNSLAYIWQDGKAILYNGGPGVERIETTVRAEAAANRDAGGSSNSIGRLLLLGGLLVVIGAAVWAIVLRKGHANAR